MGPFDVMDAGRMVILQDPTGATLSLWQAGKNIGTQLANHLNTLCWGELATPNTDTAGAFFTQLFGWSTKTGDAGGFNYTEIINGGRADWRHDANDSRVGQHFHRTGCRTSQSKIATPSLTKPIARREPQSAADRHPEYWPFLRHSRPARRGLLDH